MKLKNKGCFFAKDKKNDILFIIYVKTNEILKKKPNVKLLYIDEKTKKFKQKSHSPNKIWFVMFDKIGRDGPSLEDVSKNEFEKIIKNISVEYYDYGDYPNSFDLYSKMKESSLNKFYTKKWFESNYNFIKRQLDLLNK
jgi:hypothetical protein